MAFNDTGLFETIVGAAEQSAALAANKFANRMIENVYWGFRPSREIGHHGQTITLNIPTIDEGNVTDIGSGDIVIQEVDHTSVNLTINKKPSVAFRIQTFDQLRTPQDLQSLYLDARMEELLRKINRMLVNLATSTNFASYSTITGASDVFTRSHLSQAAENLATTGVPDDGNWKFLTHPRPYFAMLNDSSFSQSSIVGEMPADTTRRKVFASQFGFELMYDQQVPQPSSGVYAALAFHPFAIGARAVVEASQADGSIRETIVFPRPNLPVKVQMFNSAEKQGRIIHLSACIGYAVVRPEHASYMQTL